MTLDEAIVHAEKKAEELRAKVPYKVFNDDYWTQEELDCYECAKEHRQLTEWLKELKGYREARQELEDRHAVGTLDLIDSYIKEVNADEDGD